MGNIKAQFGAPLRILLNRFGQPGVQLLQPGVQTGPDYDPQPGPPTAVDIPRAAMTSVDKRYVDETVLSTDTMVVAEPFGVDPTMKDKIRTTDAEYTMIRVQRIPATGVVTAWLLFVRN